jgi:hypothetical protein
LWPGGKNLPVSQGKLDDWIKRQKDMAVYILRRGSILDSRELLAGSCIELEDCQAVRLKDNTS